MPPSPPGKAPFKLRQIDVIEEVTSHDGVTPCFTAWDGSVPVDPAIPWSRTRPAFSIQVYDTTAPASREAAAQHVWQRADRLWRVLFPRPDEHNWRLDVYGLALAADASDEERVARCIAHQEAEISSRLATGRADLYVPRNWRTGTYWAAGWTRGIIVIAEPNEERWNDGEGGLLRAYWDRSEALHQGSADRHLSRFKLQEIQQVMQGFTFGINGFYTGYVLDGELAAELASYASESKGEK